MAKARFFHVFIEKNTDATTEQLLAKMNLSLDWYRITGQNWILYSTQTPEKWKERLEALIPNGSLFICEINIEERSGRMTKDFWNWVKKDRD